MIKNSLINNKVNHRLAILNNTNLDYELLIQFVIINNNSNCNKNEQGYCGEKVQ